MRLFVALDLPEPIKDELGAEVGRWREDGPPCRWVRPAGLHLTLVFLGEVDADRVPSLEAALAETGRGCAPFRMAVRGAGSFPPSRPARVLWVGLEATPAESLMELQRRITVAGTSAVGIEPESRPFHPHITLGRCRKPWPRRPTERFLESFDRPWGEPFEVREALLIRSHLGPDGARYEPLARLPLEALP